MNITNSDVTVTPRTRVSGILTGIPISEYLVDAGDLSAGAPQMQENPQPDTLRMPQMPEQQGTPSQIPYEEQQ